MNAWWPAAQAQRVLLLGGGCLALLALTLLIATGLGWYPSPDARLSTRPLSALLFMLLGIGLAWRGQGALIERRGPRVLDRVRDPHPPSLIEGHVHRLQDVRLSGDELHLEAVRDEQRLLLVLRRQRISRPDSSSKRVLGKRRNLKRRHQQKSESRSSQVIHANDSYKVDSSLYSNSALSVFLW